MSKLSSRDKAILKEVVLAYTVTGEPVSSRSIAKFGRLGVSAATIRNSMAELEDEGYLEQPHVSAGRRPTPHAYRYYVSSLMGEPAIADADRRALDEALTRAVRREEPVLPAASRVLSELAQQVSVVLTPRMEDTVLEAVDFVGLSGGRVLCVVAAAGGFVDHKILQVDEIDEAELLRIANYLNEQFRGMSLGRIRRRLIELLEDERTRVDELLRRSVLLARKALIDDDSQDVVVDGAAGVLNYPELADVATVRRLLATFEHKVKLVNLLSRLIEGQGVRVVIDDDSDLTSELGFSLVATSYSSAERPIGSLGVLGPTRMEYPKVVALVQYLGDRLTQALEETSARA